MMGSDMGQQQQVVYDSTGGGGYGQQQPQQQYMGMQQYGGYPQQVATVQQPQQQYGGMVQQATGYGMPHDMYYKGRVPTHVTFHHSLRLAPRCFASTLVV